MTNHPVCDNIVSTGARKSQDKPEREKRMYRIKIIDNLMPTTYKWYDSEVDAYKVATAIINNRDALAVEVENLKTKKAILLTAK